MKIMKNRFHFEVRGIRGNAAARATEGGIYD